MRGTPDEIVHKRYTYDYRGRMTDVYDANNNRTHYVYGDAHKNGRLTHMYFPHATNGSYDANDYEHYAYDKVGNRTSLRKRDGQTISYTYDKRNQLTLKDAPGTFVLTSPTTRLIKLFSRTTAMRRTSIKTKAEPQATTPPMVKTNTPPWAVGEVLPTIQMVT